jgi:8-oxo-dGTP diphosphatase
MMMRIKTVSIILQNPRGEVLLQLRDANPAILWADHWTLPGGHVEGDESPEDAIRREMIEEMELDIPMQLWRTFEAVRGRANEITALEHIFTARLNVPAESLPLHEGQRIAFFSADAVTRMTLAFGYTTLLREFFASDLSGRV